MRSSSHTQERWKSGSRRSPRWTSSRSSARLFYWGLKVINAGIGWG